MLQAAASWHRRAAASAFLSFSASPRYPGFVICCCCCRMCAFWSLGGLSATVAVFPLSVPVMQHPPPASPAQHPSQASQRIAQMAPPQALTPSRGGTCWATLCRLLTAITACIVSGTCNIKVYSASALSSCFGWHGAQTARILPKGAA